MKRLHVPGAIPGSRSQSGPSGITTGIADMRNSVPATIVLDQRRPDRLAGIADGTLDSGGVGTGNEQDTVGLGELAGRGDPPSREITIARAFDHHKVDGTGFHIYVSDVVVDDDVSFRCRQHSYIGRYPVNHRPRMQHRNLGDQHRRATGYQDGAHVIKVRCQVGEADPARDSMLLVSYLGSPQRLDPLLNVCPASSDEKFTFKYRAQ